MLKRYLFPVCALAALLGSVGAPFQSHAQHSATETYAITNARIFPVAAPTIEKGTVVIRDGLIAAVGANVTAPADARVIDGTGLTIYPGLIDANTDLGIAQPAASPARAGGPTETLIRNATALTITRGTLTNTDVLIRRGKIAAIGKDLKAAADARVIDATGKYVMPGIVDCHSHSMLDAINEGTFSVTSMVRTRDVLNPTDVDLYRELAGGVTPLNLLHGSANSIGGQTTTVKIKYGRPVAESSFPARRRGSSSHSVKM